MKTVVNFSTRILLALVLVSGGANIAYAEVSASSTQPGQIEKRFERPALPRAVPAPVVEAPALEDKTTSGAEQIQFVLRSVMIEGVTVYSQEDVQSLFANLMGKKISLADLQNAVNALTRQYRTDGYVLSKAVLPPQAIASGAVKVRVVEGYVGHVIVEGEVSRTKKIAEYAKKIEGIAPLNVKTLERYILLANDLPGVSAKAVLRPSAQLGAADVVITVDQDYFEGSLGLDNRGTKFIGPLQFTTVLAGNSLFGIYDRTTFRNITTADNEELRFFDLQHEEQIGSEGTKLRLTAARSDSKPGSTLRPFQVDGESVSFSAGLYHPVIRTRAQNLTLRGIMDYRNTQTDILGVNIAEDHIRAVRLGAEFDASDTYKGVNLLDVLVSQGISALGATEDGLGRSRADGDHSFTKVELSASRLQDLPYNLSFLSAFSGQYAFDPVLSSEEYNLGGLGFGQAYDPSELTGDHGAAVHFELQYGNVVGERFFDSYQAYSFYDIGQVWQEESSLTLADHDSLSSTGLGLRFNVNEIFSGSTEVSFPLTRDFSSNGTDNPRLYFSMIGRF